MKRMCRYYPIMYKGLIAAKKEFNSINSSFRPKIIHAQNLFFQRNQVTDQNYIEMCNGLLDIVLYRDEAAYFTLEYFHSIRNTKDFCQDHIKDLAIDEKTDLFLCQVLLDQYLLLTAATLEFYIRYIYYFCLRKEIEEKKVSQIINELKFAKGQKAIAVYHYIVNKVTNRSNKESILWGDKLRRMRNLTAHEKLVEIESIQRTNLLNVTRKEPALEGKQIGHFLENEFHSNLFLMFQAMNCLLYGTPWIPGEFHENIYG